MRNYKIILGLLAALLFPIVASANSSARGWCEIGAQTVTTSGLTSTTQVQASYPGCSITVIIHGGGTATIYSDNANTPLANPFTSTLSGQWTFFAVNGRYDITLSGGGLPSSVTYSDVVLFDAASVGGVLTSTGSPAANQVTYFTSASQVTGTPTDTTPTHALFTTAGAPAFRQPTLADVAGGTAPAGTYNFSGVTLIQLRVGATLTTSANGDVGYDTTNKNWHGFANGVDSLFATIPAAAGVANEDCADWDNVAGVISLADFGAPCVSLGLSNTWTSAQTFSAAMNANAGGTLNGTFGGPTTLSGSYTTTNTGTHSGTETFTGLINCRNLESTRCVDSTNTAGWAGGDIGAWMNSACADLPALGGIINIAAPSAVTQTTIATDCGKTVLFQLGPTQITCSVQCFHILSGGSSIKGIGDASQLIAAAGLPVLTPMVYIDGTGGGTAPYNHTVSGLHLIQGRNSNVGLLQTNLSVKSNIYDLTLDGTNANNYIMIGVELLNGFAESVHNIRCQFSQMAICVGITAPTGNASNESVRDISVYAMTAVAMNYATTSQPTLLDTTHLLNVDLTSLGGSVARQGITTVSGAQSSGITSFNVAAGTSCFIGYQAWIGVPFNDEWNIVTGIAANTLTLMFPTRQSHANGERVLCGNTGIHVGQNTSNTFISQPHIEGFGTMLDCQDCRELTVISPNFGNGDAQRPTVTVTFTNGSAVIAGANSYVAGQTLDFTTTGTLPTNFAPATTYYVIATGLSGSQFEVSATKGGGAISAGSAGSGTQNAIASIGDGIRFDAGFVAKIIAPHFNGLFNTINVTNRVPTWGTTFGVSVEGYIVEGNVPGNTNEGIANNSGLDPSQNEIGCTNVYPSFNASIQCPAYLGPVGSLSFQQLSSFPSPSSTAGYDRCWGSSTSNSIWCAQNGGAAGQIALSPNALMSPNNTPSISSGFGTSPSVTFSNGTATFRVNVGTGGVASSGVVGINVGGSLWNCTVYNLTAHAGNRADDTVMTASNGTTVTVQNQTKSTGAAVAWTASDVLVFNCGGQ